MKSTVPPPGRIQEVRACLGPGEGPHEVTVRGRRLNDAGRSGKVREQGGGCRRRHTVSAKISPGKQWREVLPQGKEFPGGGYVREEPQRFGVRECWV